MKLRTKAQFAELERRCDAAMLSSDAAEQLKIMGKYLCVNIPALPPKFRAKFERMLDEHVVRVAPECWHARLMEKVRAKWKRR